MLRVESVSDDSDHWLQTRNHGGVLEIETASSVCCNEKLETKYDESELPLIREKGD